MLSEAIHYIATHSYGISKMLFLLDDFLTIDPVQNNGHKTMETLQFVFNRLNIPLHPDKTLGPDTFMTFLGIDLDTIKLQASLPPEKISRIIEVLTEFATRKTATKRELLSLLGHLNYALRIIIPGRSFVSYLLTLAHSVKELHFHVSMNRDCVSEIFMWRSFLQTWNGISFFHDDNLTDSADSELFTDASGTHGYGGYFQGKWFAEPWPNTMPKLCDKDMSIAYMELFPIVVSALLWSKNLPRKRILFHCDNITTVAIITKGRSKSPMIMKLMRTLTLCAANENFVVHAKHIPGKYNVLSDCLSRKQIKKFRALAPHADHYPHKIPSLDKLLLT
ncbi:uncharacterized protein LOC110448746 [Mizuhopecten yessoensis]|uniref:uncharacterized protein LOC110448746 n=1 Tax=Mizuhopecten yessoensis TaxID=6573 RepID=UPI000B45C42A|nr:uncharacterized protein LOC110448746 [Mizuhopecten yessoensis]